MRFFKSIIVFVFFIVICSGLLILQQTDRVLTEHFFEQENNIQVAVTGEIYKAAWNREKDFVLHTKKLKVLIKGNNLSDDKIEKLKKAEFVTLNCTSEIPSEAGNFGEFDMQKYLAAKNIKRVVYPSDGDIIFRSPDEVADNRHSLYYYGSEIRYFIEKSLVKNSDRDTAAVCMSVMTGDGRMMDSDLKTSFQRAGLSHLMAVSGAHVAYVLNPVKRLMSLIKDRRFGIRLKNVMLIPFILLLAFVSGFTPSVVRALVMSVCSVLSVIFSKRYEPLNALGLAGIISAFINPCVVFDTGFILSYGACICIYIILPVLRNVKFLSALPKSRIVDGVLCSIAVNMGLLPIIINLFNGFSLLSIFVNLAAEPLAEFICTGSFILTGVNALFLPAEICRIVSYPLTAVVSFLEDCASLSGIGMVGYHEYPSITVSSFALYYFVLLSGFLLLRQRTIKNIGKTITVSAIGVIVLLIVSVPPKSEFLFFDVGQGVSVLFSSRDGYSGLIDAGDGKKDISSLLQKQGVKKLDFAVISHGHNDHYGGFEKVLEKIDCDVVFLPDNPADKKSLEIAELCKLKKINVVFVKENVDIKVGKYTFMQLKCYQDDLNLNNSSIITSFSGEWGSAVLPGDIEAETEQLFINDFRKEIDLLCVSHHGSSTGTTDEFLKTISPKYAIISVGKKNKYGHPSSVVIDRVDDYTIDGNIYRTDRNGAVKFCFGHIFDFDGDGVAIWQKKKLTA